MDAEKKTPSDQDPKVVVRGLEGVVAAETNVSYVDGANGQLYYQGLMNNDFELALAIQMFYVLIALVGQLITDLSYGIVDPRVRVNK